MNLAWMISRKGDAIRTNMHPYIDEELEEESLYSAEWLYHNTEAPETKEEIEAMVCSWIREGSERENLSYSEYVDQSLQWATEDHIRICSPAFLHGFLSKVDELSKDYISTMRLARYDLNQEFLRARYGGMVDSSDSLEDAPKTTGIFFRISSNCFDWMPIIYEFVYSNRSSLNITEVTIVRDRFFGGNKHLIYINGINGQGYDRYPVDAFLTEWMPYKLD